MAHEIYLFLIWSEGKLLKKCRKVENVNEEADTFWGVSRFLVFCEIGWVTLVTTRLPSYPKIPRRHWSVFYTTHSDDIWINKRGNCSDDIRFGSDELKASRVKGNKTFLNFISTKVAILLIFKHYRFMGNAALNQVVERWIEKLTWRSNKACVYFCHNYCFLN